MFGLATMTAVRRIPSSPENVLAVFEFNDKDVGLASIVVRVRWNWVPSNNTFGEEGFLEFLDQ
jgi:hypothetical protein